MAITGANNINSVYSTFQNKMFQSVLQSSGMADSSIFGSMTGSSGATLGSADMSSLMQLMMMMKMMESMGMDMSELTGTSSGTDNTTTTTTTTVAGKPSTSNITTGGSIKIGNSSDAETITGTTWNTDLNTVGSFTIGNETYELVDNIGIGGDGNKGFKNVFKKGEQYYYYANGKLQEIDNTNTISASGNKKLVYNNTVYNYVKQEGTTITLQKSQTDTSGAVTATLVGSTGGDDSAQVYKIGNTSYELRGGVFVARSSTLAKDGTLDLVSGTGASFDTITEYVAGSKIVTQSGATYTRVYQHSNGKRFDASRNIYQNGNNYYEASGATLTQIDVTDLSYFAGYSSLDNSEGSAIFAGLNLADKLNPNDPTNITFFTKEVNGETRLFAIGEDNQEVDVTDNAMYYSQAKIGQNEATYNMEVTGDSIRLTSATGDAIATLTRPASNPHAVQYKEGIYKTGDTVGTNSGLKSNSYYRFDGGRFVEVTAPAEIYAVIRASDLNQYSEDSTSFTSNIDTKKYNLGDAVGNAFESANLAAAGGGNGAQYMQWEGENVTIYQRVEGGSPVAVERFTKKQEGTNVYYERSVKVNLTAIEGKGGSSGQTAWVTDNAQYKFENGKFSPKTPS